MLNLRIDVMMRNVLGSAIELPIFECSTLYHHRIVFKVVLDDLSPRLLVMRFQEFIYNTFVSSGGLSWQNQVCTYLEN